MYAGLEPLRKINEKVDEGRAGVISSSLLSIYISALLSHLNLMMFGMVDYEWLMLSDSLVFLWCSAYYLHPPVIVWNVWMKTVNRNTDNHYESLIKCGCATLYTPCPGLVYSVALTCAPRKVREASTIASRHRANFYVSSPPPAIVSFQVLLSMFSHCHLIFLGKLVSEKSFPAGWLGVWLLFLSLRGNIIG